MRIGKQQIPVINYCCARLPWILCGLLLGIAQAAPSEPESRLALVIGNARYESVPGLENPVNDAQDMRDVLRRLRFQVTYLENARGRREIQEAVNQFSDTLMRKNGVGLFYYSGHAMQIKGENYLIPIAAKIVTEADVEFETYNVNHLMRSLEQARNNLNIVILDSCRDNPFTRSLRGSGNRGLAQMDSPSGSLVIFSTAPGMTAADGQGRNGTYTKHLLRYIATPMLSIEQMLKKVRRAVLEETREHQMPWEASSLRGEFCFVDCGGIPSADGAPGAAEGALQGEKERIERERAALEAERQLIERERATWHAEQQRLAKSPPSTPPTQKPTVDEPGQVALARIEPDGLARREVTTATPAPAPPMPPGSSNDNAYRLYVDILPDEAKAKARITIVDYPEPYQPWMILAPGRYKVSITHPEYTKDINQEVEIRDRDIRLKVTFWGGDRQTVATRQPPIPERVRKSSAVSSSPAPAPVSTASTIVPSSVSAPMKTAWVPEGSHRLFVDIMPDEAKAKTRISIMDYPEPYQPWMSLAPGQYRLSIAYPGYKNLVEEVDIRDHDVILEITIEQTKNRRNRP